MFYYTEDDQARNRTRGIVCCAVYAIVLLVATHVSLGEVKENEIYLAQKEFYVDKIIQFGAYAIFAVLVGLTVIPISKDPSETVKDLAGKKLTLIGVMICAFATFDECTQPLFGRTFELSDFASNVFGIAFGLVAFVTINEVRQHLD
jgi:hypothetical protein